MSHKRAQGIVNELEEKHAFMALGYDNAELEVIKDLLEEFLELEVDTGDLDDPEDCDVLDDGDSDEEEEVDF